MWQHRRRPARGGAELVEPRLHASRRGERQYGAADAGAAVEREHEAGLQRVLEVHATPPAEGAPVLLTAAQLARLPELCQPHAEQLCVPVVGGLGERVRGRLSARVCMCGDGRRRPRPRPRASSCAYLRSTSSLVATGAPPPPPSGTSSSEISIACCHCTLVASHAATNTSVAPSSRRSTRGSSGPLTMSSRLTGNAAFTSRHSRNPPPPAAASPAAVTAPAAEKPGAMAAASSTASSHELWLSSPRTTKLISAPCASLTLASKPRFRLQKL